MNLGIVELRYTYGQILNSIYSTLINKFDNTARAVLSNFLPSILY